MHVSLRSRVEADGRGGRSTCELLTAELAETRYLLGQHLRRGSFQELELAHSRVQSTIGDTSARREEQTCVKLDRLDASRWQRARCLRKLSHVSVRQLRAYAPTAAGRRATRKGADRKSPGPENGDRRRTRRSRVSLRDQDELACAVWVADARVNRIARIAVLRFERMTHTSFCCSDAKHGGALKKHAGKLRTLFFR